MDYNLLSISISISIKYLNKFSIICPVVERDNIWSHMFEKCATTKMILIATFLEYEIWVAVAC